MRRTLAVFIGFVTLLAACGDDGSDLTSTTSSTVPGTTTSATPPTTAISTTTTLSDAALGGERIDIYPYADAALVVVGVAADTLLAVRATPNSSAESVAQLDPLADGLVATGHNRSFGTSGLWVQVDVDGVTGWVNYRFVAQPGSTDDITTQMYPRPADRPSAPSLAQLAGIIAGARGEEDPTPRVVIVDGPSVGDLGEVVVDVLDYPDDALLGERLHVFADPATTGDGFTVRSIERTLLCRRGVDPIGCA